MHHYIYIFTLSVCTPDMPAWHPSAMTPLCFCFCQSPEHGQCSSTEWVMLVWSMSPWQRICYGVDTVAFDTVWTLVLVLLHSQFYSTVLPCPYVLLVSALMPTGIWQTTSSSHSTTTTAIIPTNYTLCTLLLSLLFQIAGSAVSSVPSLL